MEVLQAFKCAIDYDAIAKNITPMLWNVWQSVLPKGSPGAIDDTPFKKDVAKAKALLAKGGYPNGFTVTHGPLLPLAVFGHRAGDPGGPGGDRDQGCTCWRPSRSRSYSKMRARQHQLVLSSWFPDYLDPNSNMQAFCANPDDSETQQAEDPRLALPFLRQGLTGLVGCGGEGAGPAKKRMAMYAKMQRQFMERSPFAMLLQNAEVDAMTKGMSGIEIGVLPDYTRYAQIAKA